MRQPAKLSARLSAPIYRLKRQAKVLSRTENIPLHEALDRIAMQEGFSQWSLLAAQTSMAAPVKELLKQLNNGDLLLVGARPGQGKTSFALELAIHSMKHGTQALFFTLEYNPTEFLNLFKSLGENPENFKDTFTFDSSDAINADYITSQLSNKPAGTIAVIDYLQLLDQKRDNPELEVQVRTLKDFAKKHEHIIVFISQIDRSYDASTNNLPTLEDVRLPNPLDLTLFDKACFIHDGEIHISDIS